MRKPIVVAGQVILLGAVGWFAWRAVSRELDDLGAIDFAWDLSVGWLALSLGAILVTFAALIEAWRTVLGGWDQRLNFPIAARIWTLSNLGRYIPGKIWSLTGMAVLAARQGIAPWAAGASAVVMQFIALATGVAVVAASAPMADVELGVHTTLMWVAAFVSVGLVAFLATRDVLTRVSRRVKPDANVKPLAPRAAVMAVLTTAAAWCLYGVAFWLTARGVGAEGLRFAAAVSAFTTSYIVGLLAVVVPGGAGVREVTIVAMLAPSIGTGPAAILAGTSRVLMTGAELVAAGTATLATGPLKAETT